jgi:hypothetical protein
LLIWFGVPNAAVILSLDTPTFSRLGFSCTDESFMGGILLEGGRAQPLCRSNRDEDESVPCDCILAAKHPASAIIGSVSNILIELESLFIRAFPPRDALLSYSSPLRA